jgi:hypothetical protein
LSDIDRDLRKSERHKTAFLIEQFAGRDSAMMLMMLEDLCKELHILGSKDIQGSIEARVLLSAIMKLGDSSGKVGGAFEAISTPREFSKFFALKFESVSENSEDGFSSDSSSESAQSTDEETVDGSDTDSSRVSRLMRKRMMDQLQTP